MGCQTTRAWRDPEREALQLQVYLQNSLPNWIFSIAVPSHGRKDSQHSPDTLINKESRWEGNLIIKAVLLSLLLLSLSCSRARLVPTCPHQKGTVERLDISHHSRHSLAPKGECASSYCTGLLSSSPQFPLLDDRCPVAPSLTGTEPHPHSSHQTSNLSQH